MFKKLFVMLLLVASTAVCMDRPEKRQAIEVTEPTGQQVTIQTAEGQEFKVNLELAKLSVTLGHLIEDVDIAAEVVPLPSVSGPIWSQIQGLLPDVQSILNPQESEEGKEASRAKIITKLTSLSGDDLIEFIKAANYLDVPDLLSLAIDVAKKMSLGQLKSIKLQSFLALEKNIRNPIIFAQMLHILGPVNVVEFAELRGHTGNVWSVYVTPDGSKIVSGSADGTIRIWDTQSHKELAELDGHTGEEIVTSVCVTPDGSKIVSGSGDETIRMWDIESHQPLAVLKGHVGSVLSVCVTPDGSKIVSGSGDGTIRIWDLKSYKELAELEDHESEVWSVCVTPDGSKIVSGSFDDTIRIWDINTHKEIAVLKGHTAVVSSVCVTPDGSKIVSGSWDNTIRIWDINTHEELAVLKGHTAGVSSVCVTPDGSKIVSGSNDKTIRIWDITIFNRLRDMSIEQARAILQYMLAGHKDGWQGIWRIVSPQSVAGVQGAAVIPVAVPMPVLPPRGEGESETKHHNKGPQM